MIDTLLSIIREPELIPMNATALDRELEANTTAGYCPICDAGPGERCREEPHAHPRIAHGLVPADHTHLARLTVVPSDTGAMPPGSAA